MQASLIMIKASSILLYCNSCRNQQFDPGYEKTPLISQSSEHLSTEMSGYTYPLMNFFTALK